MPPEPLPHTIADLIFSQHQNPDDPAIESPGYRPLTYRDLRNQVIQVIQTLHSMGFGQNDRIAVIMPGGPETAVLGIAVMAGFTHTPLNPQYREPEFQVMLPGLKVRAVIVQKGHPTAARTVAESLDIPVLEITPSNDQAGSFRMAEDVPEGGEVRFARPEDTAIVMQTSGTTSLPKIVPLTQKQVFLAVRVLAHRQSFSKNDRCLHIVPHFHLLGIIGTLLVPILAGGSVICTRDFIPSDFLTLAHTYRLTYFIAGPAHHHAILQELRNVPPHELNIPSLRLIRSVSAPLPGAVRQELGTLLRVPVVESYAMTESPNITINMATKEGSVGISLIESLVILDENGTRLAPNTTGEVAIRGEVVFGGYEEAPEENAAAFTQGWFRTGDMGYLDEEGYLFLTGRKKELVNKGGEKISPAEVDQVLMSHPAVREAMAFRVHDPVLGEDIAAMVVAEPADTGEEDLRMFLLDRLAPYKVPRRIYFVDAVPKGPTGKLLRYRGTERYSVDETPDPGQTRSAAAPAVSGVQEKLIEIWKEILPLSSVSPDDDFFRCGGNSLGAIQLIIKIQRAFALTLRPDSIYRCPTIRQQAQMIAEKTATGTVYHPLIVPIREGSTLPPLFCLHSVGGWIGIYQNIFSFFHQERPVFGIRALGLEPGEKPPVTIEDAVRHYADAIKTVQNTGPYHLLGYSAGALYAFELACRLQQRGEPVGYLGLIDQSVPSPQARVYWRVLSLLLGRRLTPAVMTSGIRAYRGVRTILQRKEGRLLTSLFMRGTGAVSCGLRILCGPQPLPDWIPTYPEKQQPLLRTHIRALENYRPPVYRGDLTFFSTGPDSIYYPGDLSRGWNSFVTGKTIIMDIPGDHATLFLDPLAPVVAKKIEESLTPGDTHE